jgi:hypothetical protein
MSDVTSGAVDSNHLDVVVDKGDTTNAPSGEALNDTRKLCEST